MCVRLSAQRRHLGNEGSSGSPRTQDYWDMTSQGQGLLVQQTWVWHKPSWGRLPFTPPQTTRPYTGLGKQTLGAHRQNLVCTRTQEKGAVTPQETDPDLPMSVQSLLWRCGSLVACWRVGGSSAVHECERAWDLLKKAAHCLHYLHHSLASDQIEREHSPAQ